MDARGAYQKCLPSQSRADQCFRRLRRHHSSQTLRMAGFSSRSSLKVVGNRKCRSERPARAGQPGWENAAASWTHSSTRPLFVDGSPYSTLFFSFPFLCCEALLLLHFSRRLANTQLRLKNWRNRTAKEEGRMKGKKRNFPGRYR